MVVTVRRLTAPVAKRERADGAVPVDEYRPGRNFVRVGDTVKCRPVSGRSFRGRVLRIFALGSVVVEIEVLREGDHKQIRTFVPERVSRVAQSRIDQR